MANLMQLEIVTPDKYFIKRDDVVYAGFDALDGGFGVFANHMPAIAALKDAPFKYRDANNEEHFIYLSGGFAEIVKNKITILSIQAEAAEDIDLERAHAALERAENRIANFTVDINIKRAEAAKARALGRIRTVELSMAAKMR